jgi:hypothetical protein
VPIGNYTELEQLINIMTNDGYISMYSIPRGYRDYILKNTCEYYFDKYENNDRKFHAEFHWLGHHPVFDLPERLPIEILLENPETIYILGRPVETMNVRNNTLAIVLHHGVREQWSTMKHILDLAQIVKSGKLDLEEVLKICRQYHFSNALYLGLQLTDELLGMKCDISYEKHLDTKRFVEQVLGGKPRRHTVWYNQWQKIKILDGVVPKVKMLLKQVYYAFTPSILDYKFIALPKPLFFLYFLVKIVRRLLTGIKLQDR